MNLAEELKIGDLVVVRGVGLGKIKSAQQDVWTVQLNREDDTADIRREKLDALLRRPMPPPEAAAAMAILGRKEGEPDLRSWGEQYLELQRTLRTGTPRDQAAALHKLYRVQGPSLAQQREIDAFEDALLPQLALALHTRVSALRAQLHRGQPAFSYTAPERDDDAPIPPLQRTPEGWQVLVSFRVFSGRMAVGEMPVSERDPVDFGDFRANIVRPCRNGDWFVLARTDNEASDFEYEYVLVARSALPAFDRHLKAESPLGSVAVEGGCVHFVDEEVRDDERYQRELENAREALGRGFSAELGGDGATEIFGASAPGSEELVLFRVAS